MIGPALVSLVIGAGLLVRAEQPDGSTGSVPADGSPRAHPYKGPLERPLEFAGPGREAPEPEVSEVVLGWFGPGDPEHPEFGGLWRGATLALEEENAAGGYRGKPFRLEPAWSESPWTAGVVGVTRLVLDRGAWAVIGGVDGTTTHLAVQLALKLHFLLLSPGSSDATADHGNVPWLFSLPPSDERVAEALAEAAAGGAFSIAVATDHDSHAAFLALRRELGRRRIGPAAVVEVTAGSADLPSATAALVRPRPRAVLLLAPATLAGRVAANLRAVGFAGMIGGGPTLAGDAFARAAGPAAEGALAPGWVEHGRPEWAAFTDAYARRWSRPPDSAAVEGYDAVRIVAAAVRRAGLNRARIRDEVRALSPWGGASGLVRWGPLGRNEPTVVLAPRHGACTSSGVFPWGLGEAGEKR